MLFEIALRKEQCRPGGSRRPIVESEDEEEQKKVSYESNFEFKMLISRNFLLDGCWRDLAG